MPRFRCWLAVAALLFVPDALRADEPLPARIDRLILAAAGNHPVSPPADDAEFLRRAWLDLAGTLPPAESVRAFLNDADPAKRDKVIDALLSGPDYPRRMADAFHVILMERLGDHPEWSAYLRSSFAANKPWDQLARELLRADPKEEAGRGAAFFLAKRLENYGQNPVDYPALARDVGRLFLGVDLRCAQCHDHPFIADYKQQHFQGLFAFVRNTALQDPKRPAVAEKPTTDKVSFVSVFTKARGETGPALPGGDMVEVPSFPKGQEFLEPPDRRANKPGVPRFSTLAALAERLPAKDTPAFARNAVNRLWHLLMGRGLVHPLDLDHSANPPSHPELLDLLAAEFVAHDYDIRWLLGELARTQTYQRSSLLPPGVDRSPPQLFLTALEKRLSAEQLCAAVAAATGEPAKADALRPKFVKAFANPAREPEDEIAPSLKAALFVLNDAAVLDVVARLAERLAQRLDAAAVAEELYLSVLSRRPTPEEREEVARTLARGTDRPAAVARLAWALLASTEFCVNH
jgi:hypothetical protein